MNFPSRLLLAMLIASPATIARAQAEPAPEQPPQDATEPEDQANPSEPPSADVDAARIDESASVDGVPPWVFDTWCISEDARPQRGWGVSRDHSAGLRYDGRTHEGTWSVVSASPGHIVLAVTTDLGRVQLDFSRGNENDASRDQMLSAYRFYTHCGSINFNERF